jgi:hypothetical protein
MNHSVTLYMHEVLILTEYSCRHEHGNRSVSIIALKENCSGLTIRLFPYSPVGPVAGRGLGGMMVIR